MELSQEYVKLRVVGKSTQGESSALLYLFHRMIPKSGSALCLVPAAITPCSSGSRLALASSEPALTAECRGAASLPCVLRASLGISQPLTRFAARLPLGGDAEGRAASPSHDYPLRRLLALRPAMMISCGGSSPLGSRFARSPGVAFLLGDTAQALLGVAGGPPPKPRAMSLRRDTCEKLPTASSQANSMCSAMHSIVRLAPTPEVW